jgi:hypothetical protein
MRILEQTYTSVVVMVCALAQTAIRARQLRRAARIVVAMRTMVECAVQPCPSLYI